MTIKDGLDEDVARVIRGMLSAAASEAFEEQLSEWRIGAAWSDRDDVVANLILSAIDDERDRRDPAAHEARGEAA